MNLKNIKQKILGFIVFLLALNLVAVPTFATNVDGGFELVTNFGIDGKLKPSTSNTMELNIKNVTGTDFVGDLEVLVPNSTGASDSYQQKVEIKNEEIKKVFMPLNQITANKKVKVRLKNDSDILFEQEVAVNAKEAQYSEAIIGVLTDEVKNLKYFEGITAGGNNYQVNGSSLVNITPELMESNYKNIQSLDMIVINDYDTSKLSELALRQLNIWINNGGILLIGGSEKTLNNLTNEFVNVDISAPKSTWFNLKEGGLTLPSGRLSGDYGNFVIGDADKFLAASQKRGVGDIVITTFDLATKNFYEFGAVQQLLTRMLESQLSRKFNWFQSGSGYPYDLFDNLNKIEVKESMDISKVIITLGIFILLASFGGYFLFKVINRRGLIWVFIPLVSIIFTFIMASMGTETSVKDKILNSVNIINVDDKGNGKLNSYMTIGNKYASSLVIEEPEGTRVEYIVPENYMPLPSGTGNDKIEVKTIYDGEKTFYDFNKVSALDLKTFRITGKEGIYNPMKSELNYIDDGMTGTITNPYDVDIENMIVVFQNNVWDLGKLEKGATFTFDKNDPTYVGTVFDYVNDFSNNYWNEQWQGTLDQNIDKYKGKMRDMLLARYASSSTDSEAYCIAITNENINYGFTFENEDISKFGKTVYVNKLNINFVDADGNTNFPLGYIKGEIESINDQLGYDTYRGTLWGSGEAVINFTFEEKFVPSVVTFKCPPVTDDKMGAQPFKGAIKIYNFKTEKYEDVTFGADTPYQLTTFTNYLKDGQIKIKIIAKDEQESKGPMISVKGRYKK